MSKHTRAETHWGAPSCTRSAMSQLPQLAANPRRETEIKSEAKGDATLRLPGIKTGIVIDVNESMKGIVEIEWIQQVAREMCEKLRITSVLTPDLLRDADIDLEPEVQTALREHFAMERELDDMDEDEDEDYEEDDIDQLNENIAASARTVAALLYEACYDNPLLEKRLRRMEAAGTDSKPFLEAVGRLRELMKYKLAMTGAEESSVREKREELSVRRSDDKEKIRVLQAQYDEDRAEHGTIIAKYDKKIARLASDIKKTKEQSSKTFKDKSSNWEATAKAETEAFNKEVKEKTELIAKLREELKDVADDNFTLEVKQHRIKYRAETNLEQIVQKYDSDMTTMHAKTVELQALYDDEAAELEKLREYFAQVQAEEDAVKAERDRITRFRNGMVQRKRTQRSAAVLLHTLFLTWFKKNAKGGKKDKKKKK